MKNSNYDYEKETYALGKYEYAFEKIDSGMSFLISSYDIKERLKLAWGHIGKLNEADLPPCIVLEFRNLKNYFADSFSPSDNDFKNMSKIIFKLHKIILEYFYKNEYKCHLDIQ